MMRIKIVILVFTGLFVVMLYGCKSTQNAHMAAETEKRPATDGYQLVWADEFSRDGTPDTASWGFENGFVRNQEWQWYQPDNAYCKNGYLIIEGRREMKPNAGYLAGSNDWRKNRENINYTSSSMNTSGRHQWKYGRFMMRGRIDISAGLWPAWWTLGVAGRWPANGEIDIMEYYNNNVLANIACMAADKKAEWFSKTKPVDSLGGRTWASQFHVWRMDWDEESIALYIDEQLMNKVELSKLVNKDDTGINPFMQPHYMLLNLAIGGQNGGDPSGTQFPKKVEIDYVRVYQQQADGQ